jgi:hypothetical protein
MKSTCFLRLRDFEREVPFFAHGSGLSLLCLLFVFERRFYGSLLRCPLSWPTTGGARTRCPVDVAWNMFGPHMMVSPSRADEGRP